MLNSTQIKNETWCLNQLEIVFTYFRGSFYKNSDIWIKCYLIALKEDYNHLMTTLFSEKYITHVTRNKNGNRLIIRERELMRPLISKYNEFAINELIKSKCTSCTKKN